VSNDDARAVVRPLHRASVTPGLTTDLMSMSAEQAATALVDEFARTGHAEAWVVDAETVRGLARTDCRRRGLRFRSVAVGATLAIFDDERHGAWLETAEGTSYRKRADEAIIAVLEDTFPTSHK
jgi:hypothetical protein